MIAMTADEIVDEVQRLLDEQGNGMFKLRAVADAARHEHDWWYVPVSPDRNGVEARSYAERLTDVEGTLSDRGIRVLLIPVLVPD